MIRINLLPHKKVKPVDKGIMRLWIAAVAAAVLLVGGSAAMYIMLSTQISGLAESKDAAQQELKDLDKKLKQVADYENKRKDYENKLAIIDQIKKMKMPLTPALLELNRLVVKDVWVDSLKINEANIVINFKSRKRESIGPFFETMQKSKSFSGLVLDSTEAFSPKLAGSKAFPFTVRGKLAGYEQQTRPKAEGNPQPEPGGKKGK